MDVVSLCGGPCGGDVIPFCLLVSSGEGGRGLPRTAPSANAWQVVNKWVSNVHANKLCITINSPDSCVHKSSSSRNFLQPGTFITIRTLTSGRVSPLETKPLEYWERYLSAMWATPTPKISKYCSQITKNALLKLLSPSI